jgi:hypothetical protein
VLRGLVYGVPMSSLATEIDRREPNEDALIARIEDVLRRKMERDYPPPGTKRDAHPKHTGLLQAVFTVAADVPAALRVGLFAEPRSYQAWIRTSNASAKPQSDAGKDVRGLAIKLLDVPGEKIAQSDEPHTQDFVVLSTPTMPLGTVRLFHDAIYLGTEWSPLVFLAKMFLTGQAAILKELAAIKILPSSPLEIRYWSTVPYQLGPDQAVKYSLWPTSSATTPLPATPGSTYLTDAIEARVARETLTFDFAVQLRQGDMPINDARPRWDEAVAPFVKVATLTVPPQAIRTEERSQLAETLSFSPAHARIEHRPIGGLNRARMRIYRSLSDFRHDRSAIPRLGGR